MNSSKKFFAGLLIVSYFFAGCITSENIRFECPEIETDLSGLESSGSLVLHGDETYLMEMASLSMTQINKPEDNWYYFAASPEHNWIAYISSATNELVVSGVDNKFMKTMPWEEDWAYVEWLNEEQLIIDLIQKDENFDTVSKFLIFNPFTDERTYLEADYPEIYSDYWWRIIEYNASFDLVLYLQGDFSSGPFYYTLWDIQNKVALAQLDPVGDLHARPSWSSDGSRFAIALSTFSKVEDLPSYEIFNVSQYGIITQLTHFSDYFPWVYVTNLSWSPDSRYIAFWYSSWNDTAPYFGDLADRYLGVLDLKTGDVTSYCIRGELDVELGMSKYSPPMWSPDSKQIIFQSQVGEHYVLDSQTILLDIQENRAFLIGEALEPVGWLKTP